MTDKKWEKLAALGGVAFVVLNIVGSIAQGAPPSSDDTNDEVLQWFVDKESGIKVAVLLGAISIIALLWWFGSLWRRMSRAESGNHRLSILALGGLVGGGALFAASTAVVATVAIQVDEVPADGAKFFYVLSTALLSMAGAFIVTHLAAVNVLSMRTRFLPTWVSALGLLAAALFLVSTARHHHRCRSRDDLRVHRLHRLVDLDPRGQRAHVAHPLVGRGSHCCSATSTVPLDRSCRYVVGRAHVTEDPEECRQ